MTERALDEPVTRSQHAADLPADQQPDETVQNVQQQDDPQHDEE